MLLRRRGAAALALAVALGGGAAEAFEASECVDGITWNFIDLEERQPSCCGGPYRENFGNLSRRESHGFGSDSLLVSLSTLYPVGQEFGITSVGARPAFDDPTWTFAKVNLKRIFAIDQKAQRFSAVLDVQLIWRDCRLLYTDDESHTVGQRHELYSKFWKPELHFAEEDPSSERRSTTESLTIHQNGLVVLRTTMSRTFACTFDFSELPFDTQSCSMTLMVPDYTVKSLLLKWVPNKPFSLPENGLSNKEWTFPDLDGFTLGSLRVEPDELGPEERVISSLSISFKMTRKTYDYYLNYIIPAFVYWLCSYGSFYVDVHAVPGRVALGLIPILTLSNKMSALRNNLPPVNSAFRLDIFMFATFCLTIAQLIEFCMANFAARIVKMTKERKATEAADPEAAAPKPNAVVRVARSALYQWAVRAEYGLDYHSRWLFPVVMLGFVSRIL